MEESPQKDLLLSDASLACNVFHVPDDTDPSIFQSTVLSLKTPETIAMASTRGPSAFQKKSNTKDELSSQMSIEPWTVPSEKEQENEHEIQRIIDLKMSKMNLFNSMVMNKRQKAIFDKYGLNPRVLETLIQCQKRIRAYIMKLKFFRAIRMNNELENKQNCIELAKSIKKYKKKVQEMSKPRDGILDFIL